MKHKLLTTPTHNVIRTKKNRISLFVAATVLAVIGTASPALADVPADPDPICTAVASDEGYYLEDCGSGVGHVVFTNLDVANRELVSVNDWFQFSLRIRQLDTGAIVLDINDELSSELPINLERTEIWWDIESRTVWVDTEQGNPQPLTVPGYDIFFYTTYAFVHVGWESVDLQYMIGAQ